MTYILFMLTEMAWLTAPLVLVEAAMPSSIPVLAAVLLHPLGWAAGRFVIRRTHRPEIEAAWCGGIVLALILAAAAASWAAGPGGERVVPSFVFAALVGAVAWLRGWLLARRAPDTRVFALSFQAGLIVVAAVLFMIADLNVALRVQFALVGALVFFGLAGLWHARAAGNGRQGGSGSPGTALLGLVAVVGIGAVLWIVFDRAALEAALAALQWALRQAGRLIVYLLGLLPEMSAPTAEIDLSLREPMPLPEVLEMPREPEAQIPRALLIGLLAAFALSAAFVFYQFFKMLMRAQRRDRTAGLEYGKTSGSFLEGLRALLQHIRERFSAVLAARLDRWRESRREGSVRGRYRRLLARLARHGWPRKAHETPEEYHRRLAPHWPDSAPHFAALTQAFVAARYGGLEPHSEHVEELWRRLKPGVGRLRKTND